MTSIQFHATKARKHTKRCEKVQNAEVPDIMVSAGYDLDKMLGSNKAKRPGA